MRALFVAVNDDHDGEPICGPPSLGEISARCERIQRGWSLAKGERRKAGWRPPRVSTSIYANEVTDQRPRTF